MSFRRPLRRYRYFPEIVNIDKSAKFFCCGGVFQGCLSDSVRAAQARLRKFVNNDQNLLQNIPSDVD